MYCNKCGALVVGKYCSCCGTKIRSQLEELRLAERRTRKEFVRAMSYSSAGALLGLSELHLAEACWIASYQKYSLGKLCWADDQIPQEAFDSITVVRDRAEQLFKRLINF